MDFFDAVTSLFSSPSRGRVRTVREENERAVALYGLPTLAAAGVVAGAKGLLAIVVLPLLALVLLITFGPRFGLDPARSLELGLKSALVCAVVNALMLFLSQPLF